MTTTVHTVINALLDKVPFHDTLLPHPRFQWQVPVTVDELLAIAKTNPNETAREQEERVMETYLTLRTNHFLFPPLRLPNRAERRKKK